MTNLCYLPLDNTFCCIPFNDFSVCCSTEKRRTVLVPTETSYFSCMTSCQLVYQFCPIKTVQKNISRCSTKSNNITPSHPCCFFSIGFTFLFFTVQTLVTNEIINMKISKTYKPQICCHLIYYHTTILKLWLVLFDSNVYEVRELFKNS